MRMIGQAGPVDISARHIVPIGVTISTVGEAKRVGARAMKMTDIPFGTTDWSEVERTEHPGETGVAYWRTRQFGELRVRMVEYSENYLADHWCHKGHILLILDGELVTEFEDGGSVTLKPGQSYQVADDTRAHRSVTEGGTKLFIVD